MLHNTFIVVLCSREAFLTPTYDIDLVWHAHQLCPMAYKTDMTKILGYVLNHDDTDQDRQAGSKLSTVSGGCSRGLSFCQVRKGTGSQVDVILNKEVRDDSGFYRGL